MSRYFALTRSHSYSLLFALPLLLLYELGALYLFRTEGSTLRNGADVLFRTLLSLGGVQGTMAAALAIIVAALVLIVLERRRRALPLRALPFLGMALESLLYASLLGVTLGTATQWLLQGWELLLSVNGFAALSPSEAIVLSLGAGLYEELVFRVLIVGGLFGVFRASGLGAGQAGLFSTILASLLFSAFHYIGPYGDVWGLPSFLFRFLAGLAFSILFLTRGFGITAWTHALYDLLLVYSIHLA